METENLMKVKAYIETIIGEIGKFRREIENRGTEKAGAIKNYKKKRAIAIATLNASESYELSGKQYKKPPVSILKTIAEGICAEDEADKVIAESAYTACMANLEALKAQLNGYQSIYRHLESI